MCLARGVLTTKNLSVHHIIPIRENDKLKLVDDNLITLCGRDHAIVEDDVSFRPVLQQLVKSPPEKILK
ncbi:MAG: HNH endonuclease [Elusimicrobiaceae bacterium]|jgi:5-methylcytosine-specific restriction endonuclease McrA|nr:HNH endonuclease [Elusimicrobiaceae bacterium]